MTSVNATNSGSTALFLLRQTRVSRLSNTGNRDAVSPSLDAIPSDRDAAITTIKRLAAAWEDKKASLAAAGNIVGAGQVSVSQVNAAYAENSGEQVSSANENVGPPVGMMSPSQFVAAKREFDIAPQGLRIYENRLKEANEQLANATDAASIEAANTRINHVNEELDKIKSTISGFSTLYNQYSSWLNSTYSVSGNMLTTDKNGKLQWGEFSVGNKYTGQFWFGHNGDGMLVEADGIVAPFLTQKLT